jgi:hypothetical protein
MNNEVRFLMSQKQLNRFAVISKIIDGHLTIAEAAVSLGISQRQVIRLKKGVITQGAKALIHKMSPSVDFGTNAMPIPSFVHIRLSKIPSHMHTIFGLNPSFSHPSLSSYLLF